jgi:hypothetical protein
MLRLNLANTSAERTQPITLPKCGTLLTYGSADVMRTFLFRFVLVMAYFTVLSIQLSMLK